MVWGMLFGMAAGVLLGAATGRTGLWLPICLMFGMLLGAIFGRSRPSGTADPATPPDHAD